MHDLVFVPAQHDFIATGGYKLVSGNIRAFRFKLKAVDLNQAAAIALETVKKRKTCIGGIHLSVCYA